MVKPRVRDTKRFFLKDVDVLRLIVGMGRIMSRKFYMGMKLHDNTDLKVHCCGTYHVQKCV